jgi:hypothetical protein
VNAIADRLGKVGLPAPVRETAEALACLEDQDVNGKNAARAVLADLADPTTAG